MTNHSSVSNLHRAVLRISRGAGQAPFVLSHRFSPAQNPSPESRDDRRVAVAKTALYMPPRRHTATFTAIVGILVALGISGCGSKQDTLVTSPPAVQQQHAHAGNPGTGTATSPTTAQEPQAHSSDTSPPLPAKDVVARPGCSELCQQAGPPQGTDDPGCPDYNSDKCAPCPAKGCAALLTRRASVHDGLIRVTLRCNAEHTCSGAFHVYLPRTLARLAASDVSVPPHETTSTEIALTPLGRLFAAYRGDFHGYVVVFLKGTGIDKLGATTDTDPAPDLRLHAHAPQARLTSCDQNISAAENTSCPFAEHVFIAYVHRGEQFTAKSPTTGRSYDMTCYSDLKTVYCAGGHDAVVTFPQRAADAYK